MTPTRRKRTGGFIGVRIGKASRAGPGHTSGGELKRLKFFHKSLTPGTEQVPNEAGRATERQTSESKRSVGPELEEPSHQIRGAQGAFARSHPSLAVTAGGKESVSRKDERVRRRGGPEGMCFTHCGNSASMNSRRVSRGGCVCARRCDGRSTKFLRFCFHSSQDELSAAHRGRRER